MCRICGCGVDHDHDHDHDHDADHDHDHDHDHDPAHAMPHGPAHHDHDARMIQLEHDLLAKNNRLAADNRDWLASRAILACNMVSSPGAGKTTLLERTIRDLGQHGQKIGSLAVPVSVIEGDQATDRDAQRVRAAGAEAFQINTGTGCHLDAIMVSRALARLDPPDGSLVFIENVGNLVCPALFDLGEASRVLVVSVTEGDDKPFKYPHMFHSSHLVVLSKIDLLPYVTFDSQAFHRACEEVNPHLTILALSATRGDGLDAWYQWLQSRRAEFLVPSPAGQP